jgi:hypothetical protein
MVDLMMKKGVKNNESLKRVLLAKDVFHKNSKSEPKKFARLCTFKVISHFCM